MQQPDVLTRRRKLRRIVQHKQGAAHRRRSFASRAKMSGQDVRLTHALVREESIRGLPVRPILARQESFYVGISRARERARIYTDDAELLGRRVEDTHTRKAAVELEGLREALRQAGYYRQRDEEERRAEREQRTERERAAERQTQAERATRTQRMTARAEQTIRRVVRQIRALRPERLAPMQRVAHSFRQWLDQKLGVERTETQRMTAREFITQAQREAQRQSQSRGIRM